MFKKTLVAAALVGAFAGSALAADVTLYGVVDLGLKYTHADSDIAGTDATDKLEMASGMQSGSRFGLKGTEDLGNGLKVGFVLENGFDADTGKLGNAGRLFGREAIVYLDGSFGQVAFGRTGNLTSGNGSWGITGNLSPFGTSWGGSVEGSTFMVGYTRMDNTISYKTPDFAGFKVYAQYSFDMNTKDNWGANVAHVEGKANTNRYGALGATYAAGGLNLVAVADWYNWSSNHVADGENLDDGYTFTLGGSYDFQVAKAYLGMQYFDNMFSKSSIGDDADTYSKIGVGLAGQFKGYGLMAGVDAPVAGGTAMFAVGYASTEETDVEAGAKKAESDRWGLSAGYTYALSKRTNVYGVAAWYQDKVENEQVTATPTYRDRDPSTATVFVGMRHKF